MSLFGGWGTGVGFRETLVGVWGAFIQSLSCVHCELYSLRPFDLCWFRFVLVCVDVVGFEDVEEDVDIGLGGCGFDFFLFFWLMTIFSRLMSMAFSFIDLEPTIKFS